MGEMFVKSITELKQEALQRLQGNWGMTILANFLYFVIVLVLGLIISIPINIAFRMAKVPGFRPDDILNEDNVNYIMENIWEIFAGKTLNSLTSNVLQWFLVGPLTVGIIIFYVRFVNRNEIEIENLFEGYKNYFKTVGIVAVYNIVVMIGLLFFIIPGIIFTYMFSQVLFIVAENPEIGVFDAMKQSAQMMKGHKLELFVFHLSFIGWIFLCILTCGLGIVVLTSYMTTALTCFYNDLKKLQMGNPSEQF